jgi:uncharacterized membrane protein YadS
MNQLFKREDYWAIWIGGFWLLLGLALFFANYSGSFERDYRQYTATMDAESRAPFKTIAWYEANDARRQLNGTETALGKWLGKLTGKPGGWTGNPLPSLWLTQEQAAAKGAPHQEAYETARTEAANLKSLAETKQREAAGAGYQNSRLNEAAEQAVVAWRTAEAQVAAVKKKAQVKPYNKLSWLVGLMIFLGFFFTLGASVMGFPAGRFAAGFVFVFFIGVLSYLLAGQADVKNLGIGYAAWAIILGLLISNTVGTPEWVKPSLLTEFYIKTGLVLLGAEILLGKILAIGLPGIFVAWVVTPIVLVTTYWFGQKVIKIPSKTLNMTVSADMSVCGVSAAVATAAACKATKEELTLSIGLSMVFTSIMMIVMPAFINWVGIPEVLGGAWIGGTIDATGAVVAAGAFLGDKALNVAATIKMIQNVLIGVIAFGVAIYFATRVEKTGEARVGAGEIWKRFPKFILGFIGASIVFSIIHQATSDVASYGLIEEGAIGAFSSNLRGWLFCLAFVSIGLSTNFKELKSHFSGGKPLILYLCGQTLNLCLTLLMAYIMFYLVFPQITANI